MKTFKAFPFFICVSGLLFLAPFIAISQETNSQLSGIVLGSTKEKLVGSSINIVHVPTQNTFLSTTNSAGYFYFSNLKPGGPYTITISHAGYKSITKENYYLTTSTGLQLNFLEFILEENNITLEQVFVSDKKIKTAVGIETIINKQQLASIPSISRNLQDYVRLVPQSKVDGDGMMSFAGINNKFNTFFIDGANNIDLLGTALSGTNGGATSTPPVSMEAIEEINVQLSPFDVSYSNFTGASINAITRSGSNQFKSSAWYFFRTEKMAGKSPIPLPVAGRPGELKRTRLSSFFNQTGGMWSSGPIIENKLFYFLLFEKQNEVEPKDYDFSIYRGNSTLAELNAYADTIRRRYNYEPGSVTESSNHLAADRLSVKLDWNPSLQHKISFSYRYNNADRQLPADNSNTSIRFSNNYPHVPTRTHSASLEWKLFLKKSKTNRLLISFNNQRNDRKISGQPFPVIRISDGIGSILLGSSRISQINLFKGSELNLIDQFRFSLQKHRFTTGADLNFTKINDLIIVDYFGAYQYNNLSSFYSNAYPTRFQRGVSLVDEPINDNSKAGAVLNSRRTGFFINDDIHINNHLLVNFGIRLDGNSLPLTLQSDTFFSTVAKPAIENYYSLEGGLPGQAMKTHWQLSPRAALTYTFPKAAITIKAGTGIFTGHILNLWGSQLYDVHTSSINKNPQLYGLTFNPDPFNQPNFQSLGLDPNKEKGSVFLIARNFKYPAVFRSAISIHKQIAPGLEVQSEFIFTKNIHEVNYTNVNIVPPAIQTPAPDQRNVFAITGPPVRISMSGGNPYTDIILMGNNKNQRGYARSFSTAITKTFVDKLQFTIGYATGHSVALFEPTGNASDISSQWVNSATVNGKNYTTLSTSDFNPGHRVYALLTNKFYWPKKKTATTITVYYNGQSGNRFSYIYSGTIINDNFNNTTNDLIYIPSQSDLENMLFEAYTLDGVNYTSIEQKNMLNAYINEDKYLRSRRGQFAERNGALLPFSHIVDLRLQQDFTFRLKTKKIQISILYDVFNFTNMLNKDWGRTYDIGSDNFPLISFTGFVNNSTLIPQYQFKPVTGKLWSIQTSTTPGNSARWISQLGLLYNLAFLIEGLPIDDPAEFSNDVCKIMK